MIIISTIFCLLFRIWIAFGKLNENPLGLLYHIHCLKYRNFLLFFWGCRITRDSMLFFLENLIHLQIKNIMLFFFYFISLKDLVNVQLLLCMQMEKLPWFEAKIGNGIRKGFYVERCIWTLICWLGLTSVVSFEVVKDQT